jgi:ferredoxin
VKKKQWGRLKLARRLFIYAILAVLLLALGNPEAFSQFWEIFPKLQFGQILSAFISEGGPGLALALLVFSLATMRFGRFFCAFLCPLGAIMDLLGLIGKKARPKARFSFKQDSIKTYIFPALLLALFWLGLSQPFGLFEPYSLLVSKSLIWKGPSLILLGAMLLSFYRGRAFCNSLCPTGFVLRLLSRHSVFGVRFRGDCLGCGACARVCPASAMDFDNKRVDANRCLLCLECLSVCPASSLSYLALPLKSDPSRGRRSFLSCFGKYAAAGLYAGAYLTPASLRAKTFPGPAESPVLPPGALSLAHLSAHCSLCHTCVRVCPNQAISPSPALTPSLWDKPVIDAYQGFCQYDCVLCGEVCPTGALLPLRVEEKRLTRLGLARLEREECVVVKNGTSCGACAELCPTGAVSMLPGPSGREEPTMSASYCIGCGACQKACPVRPVAAIRVEGVPYQETAVPPVKVETEDLPPPEDFPF